MKFCTAAVLLAYLSVVTASPFIEMLRELFTVTEPDIGLDRTPLVTASRKELATLKLFAEYSGAAYCRNVVKDPNSIFVTCKNNGGSCKLVEANSAFIFHSFFEVGNRLTTGYFSIDGEEKLIVLAFRGSPGISSNSFSNNLEFGKEETDICGTENTHDKCIVHRGYLGSWREIQPTIEARLAAAVAAYPDYKVVFTGHSLGGAVAAIGAAVMRNAGYHIDLYTYGQPRIGSADISTYITNQAPAKGANYRVTDWNDAVSNFPMHDSTSTEAWDHFSPEYWIATDETNIKPSDVHVISTPLYSVRGNSNFHPTISAIAAHKRYFGQISSCH